MTEFEDNETGLEETGDDAQYTISRAAAELLHEVALLVGDDVWALAMNFMQEKMNGQSWIDQYVGMTTLGAVLEGPDTSMIAS